MSVSYAAILWNKQKKVYDIGVLIFVLSFTVLFFGGHAVLLPNATYATVLSRNLGL